MIEPAPSYPDVLRFPEPPAVSFPGFSGQAFAVLKEIKAAPHIDTYRAHKATIKADIKDPFKVFRDYLVVNWVLPNRLPLETERNVFSRLLKNDFGAGGCHHHLWLSFYRTGRKRLRDIQLDFKLRDAGFSVSLYIGDNAPELLKIIRTRMAAVSAVWLPYTQELLARGGWSFHIRPHNGSRDEVMTFTDAIDAMPDELERARGVWWQTRFSEKDIAGQGRDLVRRSLAAVDQLWPLYSEFLSSTD